MHKCNYDITSLLGIKLDLSSIDNAAETVYGLKDIISDGILGIELGGDLNNLNVNAFNGLKRANGDIVLDMVDDMLKDIDLSDINDITSVLGINLDLSSIDKAAETVYGLKDIISDGIMGIELGGDLNNLKNAQFEKTNFDKLNIAKREELLYN